MPVNEKQVLRRELLARRGAIPPERKRVWDAALNAALLAHPWFSQAQTILAYYPMGSEPDIRPALRTALRQGKLVAFPRCLPQTRAMQFYPVDSLEVLAAGAHGIPAPEGTGEGLREGLCLVPALAYDEEGFRLGYGGGYYDRFLAQNTKLRALGICYEALLCARLPRQTTDIAVRRVLTQRTCDLGRTASNAPERNDQYEHERQEQSERSGSVLAGPQF